MFFRGMRLLPPRAGMMAMRTSYPLPADSQEDLPWTGRHIDAAYIELMKALMCKA